MWNINVAIRWVMTRLRLAPSHVLIVVLVVELLSVVPMPRFDFQGVDR